MPVLGNNEIEQLHQGIERTSSVFLDLIGSDQPKTERDRESKNCENMEMDLFDISQLQTQTNSESTKR